MVFIRGEVLRPIGEKLTRGGRVDGLDAALGALFTSAPNERQRRGRTGSWQYG